MVSGLDFIFIFLVRTTYPSGEVTGVEPVPNHSHLPTTSNSLFPAPSFLPMIHIFFIPTHAILPKKEKKGDDDDEEDDKRAKTIKI